MEIQHRCVFLKMRYFLFLLVFSVSCRLPQTLEGHYYESYHGFGGANYYFHKDGTFEYDYSSCTGGSEGYGKYVVDKDSIHFYFLPFHASDSSKPQMNILRSGAPTTEKIELEFSVRDDSTLEGIPFVVIVLKDSIGNTLKGTQTDLDGKCNISYSGYSGSIKIEIKMIGYEQMARPLNGNTNYVFDIRLHEKKFNGYIEGGTHFDFYARKSGKKIVYKIKVRDTVFEHDKLRVRNTAFKPVLTPVK